MKKDKYTNFGVRIPREAKPWALIFAYGILFCIALYGIAKVAERYSEDFSWP